MSPLVVLFFIFLTNLVICENLALYQQHKDRLTRFKCSLPKPLTITTVELFKNEAEKLGNLELLHPWKTILHRCGDHSGCCESPYQACDVVVFENVTLTFVNIKSREESSKYINLVAANHTRCSCQNIS